MRQKAAVTLALFSVLFFNCKRDSQPEEVRPVQVPSDQIFLIVEKVVSGPALSGSWLEPFGLAESRDGFIFVVDRKANSVLRLTQDLTPDKQIGGYGTGAESFNSPSYVTVDNNLNIYISDENNRRVARFDARLNFVDEIAFRAEEDPFLFGYPSGVCVTSYGEVWIADRDKNRLALFNNVGRFNKFLGDFGSSEGQLQSPEKIVTEPGGKFYVCDAGHGRIVLYDEFGNYMRKIEFMDIDYPISVALEKDAMWVLDGGASKVCFTDRFGKTMKQFGPILVGNQTPLKEPSDIAMLSNGKLLISDSGNRRLLLCRVERGDDR
jgi:DNA-binding beta-propeller fold protein YncE